MKLFILEHCPHCKRAKKWMEELCKENPLYKQIPIELIDERKEETLAATYDYYYVPCFFEGDTKLHEGAASKEIIKNIFDNYLKER